MARTLVHASDIANLTRPLENALKWAGFVLEEFWNQRSVAMRLRLTVLFNGFRSPE